MKKNIVTVLVLALLIGVAAFFYFRGDSDGPVAAHIEQRDFAVKDTSAITKIYLADTQNRTILLQREVGGPWNVNDYGWACQECVQLLLKTILMTKVKNPVPQTAFESVVKQISGKHVKVEIYTDGDKPEKIWYIGNPTKDHYGTYMLLETPKNGKSTVPFITEVPGFNGYLSARFHTDLASWRYKGIFAFKHGSIDRFEFDMRDFPQQSFMAHRVADYKYTFQPLNQPAVKMPYDSLRFGAYLKHFENIRCENFVTALEQSKIDSIIASPYLYRFTITNTAGETTELKVYQKPPRPENNDSNGDPLPYDPEFFYASLDGQTLMIIQNFVFEKLFVPMATFRQSTMGGFNALNEPAS